MIELVEGLERHIYIGEVTFEQDQLVIHNAHILRYWCAEQGPAPHNTVGLGRYILHGKYANDLVDKTGTVRLFRSTVVARTECPLELSKYI